MVIDFAERISTADRLAPWIRHQHLQRYAWACGFAAGAAVLDVACGTGYGADILCRQGAAARVDGFDLSPQAIEQARREFGGRENVRFEVGDVTRLPVPDASYDVYTSFETIEHVPDDRALVAEAARVLKPAGRFICSTPNRRLFAPGGALEDRPHNPHHVREYTLDEFQSLLEPFFGAIDWYGQGLYPDWYSEVLAAVGRRIRKLALRMHQVQKVCTIPWQGAARQHPRALVNGRQPEILIAVCTRK